MDPTSMGKSWGYPIYHQFLDGTKSTIITNQPWKTPKFRPGRKPPELRKTNAMYGDGKHQTHLSRDYFGMIDKWLIQGGAPKDS